MGLTWRDFVPALPDYSKPWSAGGGLSAIPPGPGPVTPDNADEQKALDGLRDTFLKALDGTNQLLGFIIVALVAVALFKD